MPSRKCYHIKKESLKKFNIQYENADVEIIDLAVKEKKTRRSYTFKDKVAWLVGFVLEISFEAGVGWWVLIDISRLWIGRIPRVKQFDVVAIHTIAKRHPKKMFILG